jgi:hypothetical protein
MTVYIQHELTNGQLEMLVEQLRRRTKRMLAMFTLVSVVLTAAIVCFAFLGWRKSKAIDKAVENVAFSQFSEGYAENISLVTPEVNTIQFLRRGYSIIFDSVQYKQEGLTLSGTVGNPTHLWISSLALKFTARPYPYTFRDKWLQSYRSDDSSGFILWYPNWDIGTGQTTVGYLSPGTSAPFSVTIPNVKQTSEQIQIEVEFTGERYSYLNAR